MSEMQRYSTHSSDHDLLTACLDGDQEAWHALVEKYQRLVYAIPVRYRLRPEDAADVFQAVWTDLYRDLARIENAAALKGWLSTAAARRSLLVRKQRERALGTLEADARIADPAPDLTTIRAEAEKNQIVREAFGELPERCQHLIRMLFFDIPPKAYREVAEELGLAEGSIGFIRGRCLQQLRKRIESAGG